jgi:tRNA threonylcarbamoyl adenosine modification protein YeaZ
MSDVDESSRPFRILAIDTALGATSACLMDAGAEEPLLVEHDLMERGHAEALIPAVQRLVARDPLGFAGVDQIAVTVGPGSFTGLRVGVSAARAMGLGLGIPVVGISTLAAYAAPLVTRLEVGVVAVALDARHGALYVQVFAPGGRTLVSPRLLPVREAARALGSGPARIAGTGAAALAVEAWALGLKADVVDMRPAPDIAWVARLGLGADPDSARPVPLYLASISAAPQEGARIARR